MSSVEKFYSSIAKIYDLQLHINGSKRAVNFFVRQLPFTEKKRLRVLDAGAGTGLFTLAILKKFPKAEIVAIDMNPDMLDELKDNLGKRGLSESVKVLMADISKPFADIKGKFDLIVTGSVLEYVNQDEAVGNLTSYLKPGGFFFNSPMKDNVWGRLVGIGFKFKPYSRERSLRAFANAGLTLVKSLKLAPLYFPVSLVKEGYIFKKPE
ncbi:MAG: class I SAM-dependent methyltransferase [Deltaproteobacteria bacterium]